MDLQRYLVASFLFSVSTFTYTVELKYSYSSWTFDWISVIAGTYSAFDVVMLWECVRKS